jgi:hypothetical protein
MFGLNSDDKKRIQTLMQDSQSDFVFDKSGVKNRILSTIENAHLNPKTFKTAKNVNVWRWNTALASCLGMIVIFSATIVYADSSNPGDKLYFLDQLQERVVLKMPRSDQAKARLQERLVNERVNELNKIPTINHLDQTVRLKAIEESQQNLFNAVEETTRIRESLKLKGRDKAVENIDEVLLKLGQLAEKQEARVEEFKKHTENEEDVLKLEENLEAIKKAGLKARLESDKRGDVIEESKEEDNSDERIEFKGPPLIDSN